MSIEKLDEVALINMIEAAEADSIEFMNPIIVKADEADSYYACEARGDEEPGYSTYTSSQVADLIDADMPTLVRIFIGAGQVLEFQPCNKSNPEDAKEAQEKTAYIEDLIKNAPNSFRVMYGALMAVELHPISVLRYGFDEKKTIKIREHHGISLESFILFQEQYREEYDIVDIVEYEVEDQPDGDQIIDVEFRLTKKEDCAAYVKRVTLNNLVLTYDATHKGDSRLIAERVLSRRGDLVAAGYPKDKVAEIPTASAKPVNDTYGYSGRAQQSSVEWASEYVEGIDGFMRVDANGDGIIELRRILKYGSVLLENKEIEDDPREINFAFGSATLLPDNVVGMSRAERVVPYQDVMTSISRAMLDNTDQVTRGRVLVNTSGEMGVNFFDVTGDASIIRVNPKAGQPMTEAVTPLQIQSVAQEALMVIQFLDSQRAQSTGSLLANQGLKADSLHKETATRFQGVDDSAQAKVELVVRVIAETMVKDLYEGMAYMSQKYATKAREVTIGGKSVKVNPNNWSRDHTCSAAVGTAYGDNQKTLETIQQLLSISASLQGTGISDGKKLYNLVRKYTMASGMYNVTDYFNDPEVPEQTLMAENEAYKKKIAQLEEQIQANQPLIQIEQMRAEQKMADSKLKAQSQLITDGAKLEQSNKQFAVTTALELTRMENEANKQLDSELQQNEKTVTADV